MLNWNQEQQEIIKKSQLRVGRGPYPWVLCLQGELGAGKTSFVKSVLEPLGFEDVSSPTYALHQTYKLKTLGSDENSPDFRNLFQSQWGFSRDKLLHLKVDHWDLYRLRSGSELVDLGFWEQLAVSQIVFVEWPQIILKDLSLVPGFDLISL